MRDGTMQSAQRRVPDDRGSATVLTAATLAVVVVVALAVIAAGGVFVAQAHASSAADLSALAAARVDRDLRAQGVAPGVALRRACDVARDVASSNQATLTRCVRGGGLSVEVTVSVRAGNWPRPLAASARAGPAWG